MTESIKFINLSSTLAKGPHALRGVFFCLAFVNIGALLTGCGSELVTIKPRITGLFDDKSSLVHEVREITVDAQSAMKRADQLLQQGNKDEALYYYVRVLEFDSENKVALNKIGAIHAGQGNNGPAETAYQLVLKLEPQNATALEGLGLIQLNTGKQAEAKQSLAAAVAVDPSLWRSFNGLGLIADQNGDYSNASQYYESALKTKPNMPMLVNNLGYSKYLSGDWRGAMQLFDAVSKLDAKYNPAWLNQGLVYARQGDDAAAIQAFMHVLDEADAYNNLGYIYMLNDNAHAASEYFQKAISLSPTYHKLANENLKRLQASEN
ncbi:MAG: tetratricopeptide repeat protein [Methylococcaceae bacterium]|nr:tetratricopeptide repeat protein [Methylococcaceae bacterium]